MVVASVTWLCTSDTCVSLVRAVHVSLVTPAVVAAAVPVGFCQFCGGGQHGARPVHTSTAVHRPASRTFACGGSTATRRDCAIMHMHAGCGQMACQQRLAGQSRVAAMGRSMKMHALEVLLLASLQCSSAWGWNCGDVDTHHMWICQQRSRRCLAWNRCC